MRVLVTGGCGFIGHHLVRRLLADRHQVVVLDDLSTGARANLEPHPGLRLVEGSVLDPAAVSACADAVDMVLHLAAVVGVERVFGSEQHAYQVSVAGSNAVLEATQPAPFVLFSSSAVYGLGDHAAAADGCTAGREAAETYDGGTPGYATGKWEAEQRVVAAGQQGRPVMILRPFNVVGPGQRSAYGMVLPRFIEQATAGAPLTIYDDGLQRRCFNDVHTFVEVVLKLVDLPAAWHPPGNVVDVSSNRAISIHELAEIVLSEARSDSPLRFVPFASRFPGRRDVRGRTPDMRRLEVLLGPVHWPPLRDIVRELLQLRSAAPGVAHGHV